MGSAIVAALAAAAAAALGGLSLLAVAASANPTSRPYVPFRTSPLDQSSHVHHDLKLDEKDKNGEREDPPTTASRNYDPDSVTENPKCPLRFSLGVSRRVHSMATHPRSLSIGEPPVIYPVLPSRGSGRQILFTTQYEHVDLLTPAHVTPLSRRGGAAANAAAKDGTWAHTAQAGTKGKKAGPDNGKGEDQSAYSSFSSSSTERKSGTGTSGSVFKEGLVQHQGFPLLFESSSFLTSPILHDINGDGVPEAIVADYDGGIYTIGLRPKDSGRRHFHRAQVPRMYVRRHWMISRLNETITGREEHPEHKTDKQHHEQKDIQSNDPHIDDDYVAHRHRSRRDIEPPHDPFHSYFEYVYDHDTGPGSTKHMLQGVTADVLGHDHSDVQALQERRRNRPHLGEKEATADGSVSIPISEDATGETNSEASDHRRLQEIPQNNQQLHEQQRLQNEEQQLQEQQLRQVQGQQQEQQAQEHRQDQQQGQAREHIEGQLQTEKHELEHHEAQQERDVQVMESGTKDGASDEGDVNSRDYEFEDKPVMEGDDVYMVGDHDDRYIDDRFDRDGNRVSKRRDDMDEIASEEDGDQPARPRHDDEYPRYDDYYDGAYDNGHRDYYDDKHYIRLPPHILCTPVLAEMPKLYSKQNESEDMLFVAVSYYFDEDEYEGFFSYKRFEATDHGDETEVQRGMYVASALMVYQFGESPRWGRQEHLDLSGDHTAPLNATLVGQFPLLEDNSAMGAFALSSPTVADIDGDGTFEVLLGTSMGFVYGFDARHLYAKENFPVQMKHGVESRILVEDVRGDTNLEIFVMDIGGNVVCLDHKANKIWHRDLLNNAELHVSSTVRASSPMMLGDIDGDGKLDIVVALRIKGPPTQKQQVHYIFALSADTGKNIENFPIRVSGPPKDPGVNKYNDEDVHQKLPAPLLVDLHADQSFLTDYLRRNGTAWSKRSRPATEFPPHGGLASGLHIVQPIEDKLIIVEGGSGCIQTLAIGEEIPAMVQADDIHGTNKLDLVVSTASGNVMTLESSSLPFHPLNTWNHGEIRGRTNSFAHGYSASQGIFVHEVSRQYHDVFGVYIPVTFELFDNRPNIQNEPGKRVYHVEVRDGTASSRALFRQVYNQTGIYTERLFIPYGPGYYTLTAVLKTSHGLIYEDTFHLGYNVHYMDGFGMLLWLPLVIAALTIFMCGSSKPASHWSDEDYEGDEQNGNQGILGATPP